MKTRCIETTSRVIERHTYKISRIAKFYKSWTNDTYLCTKFVFNYNSGNLKRENNTSSITLNDAISQDWEIWEIDKYN